MTAEKIAEVKEITAKETVAKEIPSKSEKEKILIKTVKFSGKDLKLYSLDGNTWSSRKEELLTIKERFDTNRLSMTLDGAKQGKRLFGKAKRSPNAKAVVPVAAFVDDEIETDFEDPFVTVPEVVEVETADFVDFEDDEPTTGAKKKGKAEKNSKFGMLSGKGKIEKEKDKLNKKIVKPGKEKTIKAVKSITKDSDKSKLKSKPVVNKKAVKVVKPKPNKVKKGKK